MKILYIAKHGSGGSDDEGAIAHALHCLGHQVICLSEDQATSSLHQGVPPLGLDLVLFHKWKDIQFLDKLKVKKAFWYFDLVDYPDPSLASRCRQRKAWMELVTPQVDLGFCTDGDWVNQDRTGKLRRLTQGADERILGKALSQLPNRSQILFTGISRGGGSSRMLFVNFLREIYGQRLLHISSGEYREKLRQHIANHPFVVCPDSPVTPKYWSNRIYNAAGFGGFVLHPYCGEKLLEEYESDKEVIYYRDLEELVYFIDFYQGHPQAREKISQRALERTKECHLYRHRCQKLIQKVEKL